MSLRRSQPEVSEDIIAIAQLIGRYLVAHPCAADTVEGIQKWWLKRQCYEESFAKVQQALDYLSETGFVTRRVEPDGKTVYAYAPTQISNSQ